MGEFKKHGDGTVGLAKVVIDCGVRIPSSFRNALSAVFRDNIYTAFSTNKDIYLSCFDRFFDQRPLSPEELEQLTRHIANSKSFAPLLSTSAAFPRAMGGMTQDQQESILKTLS